MVIPKGKAGICVTSNVTYANGPTVERTRERVSAKQPRGYVYDFKRARWFEFQMKSAT